MEVVKNTERPEQKVYINFFTTNYGEIRYHKLILHFLFTFFSISSIVLFFLIIFNEVIFKNEMIDYFKVTGIYLDQLYEYCKYYVINSISVIDNFNKLNEFLPLINNVVHSYLSSFPYIPNFNINTVEWFKNNGYEINLQMNIGQILTIIISLIITFFLYVGSVFQMRYQLQIRYSKVVTYYVPIFFLYHFYKRFDNKYIYVKLINNLRDKTVGKEDKERILQKIFKEYDTETYEINFVELDFKGFYHYTKIELVNKNEEIKEEELNIDNEDEVEVKDNEEVKKETKKPIKQSSKDLL